MLAPILVSETMIREILANNEPRSIDPAVSSVIFLCSKWGDRLSNEFHIVHDRSKPVYAERNFIEKFMTRDIEPQAIGYDRRTMTFPLRARSLAFGDSQVIPQLQVSDIVAGGLAAFGVNKINKRDHDLAKMLDGVGILRFVVNAIWPSPEVDPKKLGTDQVGGINPVDHIAEFLEKRA